MMTSDFILDFSNDKFINIHSWSVILISLYEGGSKSSRKSAAKFVIVMGNLRSLCML